MTTRLLALAAPLTLFASASFAPALVNTPAPLTQDVEKPLHERYHMLVAEDEFDGVVALWKVNEPRVLSTIDRDLEGSLSIWEGAQAREDKALTADELAKIGELHGRALYGARAADQAFGRTIFSDYASSFVSWNDAQKADFRGGQGAFGDAMRAAGKGDWEAALAAATKCTDLALPLGDWWGAAMGFGLAGTAHAQLGDTPAALRALAQSRLINAGLGLRGAERRDLAGMLTLLEANGQTQRALAVLDDLLSDANDQERKELEAKRLQLVHAGL